MLSKPTLATFLAALLWLSASPASAANILFVSDSGADTGIATTLTTDGHTVTMRSADFSGGMNPALRVDLSEYDAVFWSASGTGYGDNHTDTAAFANLTRYVMDGGRVFVTGYDSIASPTDAMLIAFVGGTGSVDVPGSVGACIATPTSLTSGAEMLTGVTPSGGSGDRDALTGLMADTTGVCPTAGGTGQFQWTLRRLGSGEIAYVSNGDGGAESNAAWITMGNAYRGAVRNFAQAAEGASREPGAPLVEFTSPFAADEGEEIVVMVAVSDEEGDPVTWSWDLDDDGTFGEMPGAASVTIAAGTTDGPTPVRISVQASDGTRMTERRRTIGIANIDPRITSAPPTGTSVGAMLSYPIEVLDPGGALDPLTFTITTGPMGATISSAGVFQWIPTDLEVTMPGDTTVIEVLVDDGDEGTATQRWEMTVSPNRAPSGLAILYPTGIAIANPTPRLVVANGADPDIEDTLTYYFELGTDLEFMEPLIASSGAVEQGTGYTAFQVSDALAPGRYYWRAWLSDGSVESEPMTATFLVVPDPTADGGVTLADGEVVLPDGGTTMMPDTPRGGCSLSPSRAPTGAAGLLTLLVCGLALTRRRRLA